MIMAKHFQWASGCSQDASYSDKILSHLFGCILFNASFIIRVVLGMAGWLMRVYNFYQWHQCRRPRLYINCAKLMVGEREGGRAKCKRTSKLAIFFRPIMQFSSKVSKTRGALCQHSEIKIQFDEMSHLLVVLLSSFKSE